MKRIDIETSRRTEMLDITDRVAAALRGLRTGSGICHVFVPHTTCGLTVNENADPSVRADILRKLAELVPERDRYEHAEGNSDAHVKAAMTGSSVLVPVQEGVLRLGTWQGIYLCEFDGPRTRQVWVTMIGA